MLNYKMYENVKKAIRYTIVISLFFSCRTAVDSTQSVVDEPLYMSRPKILLDSNRTSLPVLLSWEEVNGAKSYEMQVSDTADFNSSLQNWTLRGNTFSFSDMKSEQMFLRIRSVYPGGTSRWSETLIIRKEGSEIYLQWDR